MRTPQVRRPEVLCQQALERVLTYLGDDSRELTVATCNQALQLLQSALAEGAGADLPARCVARIPDYFERPAGTIPVVSPPLARGTIGYD